MSSTIVNLVPVSIFPGNGFNSFIFNKNSLGLDLSIFILTAIKFTLSPKFNVKSLK